MSGRAGGAHQMSLKQKLFVSNCIMIILPFLVFCVIGFFAILVMKDVYWESIEKLFSDRNEVVYTQSLIYGELEKLSESDPLTSSQRQAAMRRLISEVGDLGYHMQYQLNGVEEFSNITTDDEQRINETLGEKTRQLDHLTASKGDIHFIKTTWDNDGNRVVIRAVNAGHVVKPTAFSFFYTYVGFFLFLIFFFVLFTMIVVNTIVYSKAKKTVLEPLQQISRAARAIRAGNLNEPITAFSKDELGQVCRDFSDMQAYLRESMKQQIAYEQKRKELLSGISHDLRTPLTSIKGYTEGLLAGIASTPDKQERYYKAIQTRADDLSRLVDNLSLYNHFANPKFMYEPQVCSFSKILQTYVSSERGRMEKDHVTVSWSLETREDLVYIDVTEFRRVLDNLFNNAVKYRTAEASQIQLRLEKEGKHLVFLFSDDGPGIEEDGAENIFEAFVRLDAARTHTNQGSGLGLAIVRKIVEAHQGTVRAYNDHGLTICITLPLYQK